MDPSGVEAGNVTARHAQLLQRLSENQEHQEHLAKVMTHWSPPSQAYVDYCKEMHNELPRCFELTHAEMANVELHLAQGGSSDRAKAFEIIQEAAKRWQREREERKQFFQEAEDIFNRRITAAEELLAVHPA